MCRDNGAFRECLSALWGVMFGACSWILSGFAASVDPHWLMISQTDVEPGPGKRDAPMPARLEIERRGDEA